MSDIYFTSDLHFGHKAMAATGKGWRPFDTVSEHDEALIANWNSVVRPQDRVWVLGDVGLGSDHHSWDCIHRCNGTKHLIAGNHDGCWPGHRESFKSQLDWLCAGFESIQAFGRLKLWKGQDALMSHFPYEGDHTDERYSQYRLKDEGLPLLHGHVHDSWKIQGRQINVGVDVWDWRPVSIDEIRQIVREMQ